MQSLDEEATAIFLELIGKLKGGQYIQLEAGRYMPLYFECVGHMVMIEIFFEWIIRV